MLKHLNYFPEHPVTTVISAVGAVQSWLLAPPDCLVDYLFAHVVRVLGLMQRYCYYLSSKRISIAKWHFHTITNSSLKGATIFMATVAKGVSGVEELLPRGLNQTPCV